MVKKYLSLERLTEYDTLIKAEIVAGDESNLSSANAYTDEKIAEAKSYADSAATSAASAVKNDLLNGAVEAYDTLKELGDLIDDNQDAIEALETIASGKADATHTHDDMYYTEAEVDTALEAKADSNHTHDYATTSSAGFMSATDKAKLNGIADGAASVTIREW